MVAETRTPSDVLVEARLAQGLFGDRKRSLFDRLTSVPALVAMLLGVMVLAAGPLHDLDLFLAKRWLYRVAPELLPFTQHVLDRIAGQAICLPVLAVVAIVIARRRRSWRPILLGGLAELGFLLGVGSLKVLTARGVTYERDPRFFEAGFLEMGSKGISFPSGHASEAVLIYGMAVYLIAHYTAASDRLVRILRWAVVAITINSVAASFLIGWHWATDLVGGVVAGGLVLRIIVEWDRYSRRRTAVATTSETVPST